MYTSNEKTKFIKDVKEILIRKSCERLFGNSQIRDEEEFKYGLETFKELYSNEYDEREEDKPIEIHDDILGSYTPMCSPGIISIEIYNQLEFFQDNISNMICSGYNITFANYKMMVELTILKTFYHEYFHHFSDITLQLFNFLKDKDTEEALAVAWSRMKVNEFVNKATKNSNISTSLYETYLRKIYNYSISGYKDWKKYILPEDFCGKVIDYMYPSSAYSLIKNGVNFEMMILNTLNMIYETSNAVEYRIE